MARLEEVCEILDNKRVPITAKDRVAGPYPYYGANGVQDYVADYIFDDELVLLAEDGGHFGSADKPIAYRVSGKCWVNNHAHVLKAKASIDVDYLCYSLMFRDVSDIVNGATRQKLNQADMRKIEIPLLPLEEQRVVVAKISKVFKLIALRKEQLAKLDQLVKSRFIELFGEPLTLLESGKTISLEKVFSEITVGFVGEAASSYVKVGIPYLRTQNVRKGYIDFSGLIYISEEFHGVNRKSQIKPGDIVVSRVGVNRGMAAVIPQTLEEANIANCLIIKKEKTVNSEYLAYYLNMSYGLSPKFGASVGSAQGVINTAILKKWEVFLPPYSQQEQFASFVEQTDKSKLAIQQSLDKLELLKKSLMQEYFG